MREKNNMLQYILQTKVEQFIAEFVKNSKALYFDDDGKVIHPGEFGMYREKISIDLLRNIVPMRLEFGTGFIIDSKGNVSHQCDIIIYDSQNTPLIENNEKQRFFPVECVVGVGEVKSDLSKSDLKDALCKLSNVKKIRMNIENGRSKIFDALDERKKNYNPAINPRDQLFTFLICDTLNFKSDNLVNEFNDIYGDIESIFRHNMLLSIKDGTFMYCDANGKPIYYPYIGEEIFANCEIKPYETVDDTSFIYNNAHIFSFLNYTYQGIASGSIIYPELTYYLVNGLHENIIYENKTKDDN